MADNFSQVITPDSTTQDMPMIGPAKANTGRDTLIDRADLGDVAEAAFRTQNTVGLAYSYLNAHKADDAPVAGFNPYAHFRENQERDKDLLPAVTGSSFQFDNIQSPKQYDSWAQYQRQIIKDKETLARADGLGHVVSLGVGLLDATNLISGGALLTAPIKATSILGRAAVGATTFGIDQAAQSAIQLGLDDTKSRQEAFMEIGTGIALGAVLGPIMLHAKPNNALRPDHPDNPLASGNLDKSLPITEQRVGQTFDEADSVGAMRATRAADDIREMQATLAPAGKLTDWVGNNRFTPLGRLPGYLTSVRDSMLRLIDGGGRITQANAVGIANAPSAETLKGLWEQHKNGVLNEVNDVYSKLNRDLGQSELKTGMNDAVFNATLGGVDRGAVDRRTFEGAINVIQRESNAESTNGEIQQKVRKFLGDQGLQGDSLEKAYKASFEAEALLNKGYNDIYDRALKLGYTDGANRPTRYGKPQLWDKDAIDANPVDIELRLNEHLGDKPLDHWLMDEGHIKDPEAKPQVDGQGNTLEGPKYSSWEELKKEDPNYAQQVLADWRGEENDFTNELLDAKVQHWEQKLQQSKERAAQVANSHAEASRDYREAKLDEMKATGAAMQQRAVSRIVASATLKADKAEAKVKAIFERYSHMGGNPDQLHAELSEQLAQSGMKLDELGPKVKALEARTNEAESLVADLRGQRGDVLERKAQVAVEFPPNTANKSHHMVPLREEHTAIKKELQQALEDLKVVRAEQQEATRIFDDVAANQTEAARWRDAAAKDVNTLIKNEENALMAPGLHAVELGNLSRAETLERELAEATEARRQAIQARLARGQDLKAAESAVNKSSSQLRKAVYRRNKLSGDESPVQKFSREWVRNMRGMEYAPSGIDLTQDAKLSGRVQERRFKFSAAEAEALEASGYLKSNPHDVFDAYARDMGGRLAVHEAWEGKGLSSKLADVDYEYNPLIAAAKDEKTRQKLQADRNQAHEDITTAHNRIIGKYDPRDRNGIVYTADMIRKLGFARYVSGFGIAAIGDLATAAFTAPGSVLGAITFKGYRQMREIIEAAKAGDADYRQLRQIFGSLETGAHMHMSERALARDDARRSVGFGTGTTREVSRAVEKGLDVVADFGAKLGAVNLISDNIRRTAGIAQLARLRDMTKGYDALTHGQKVELAALGVGEREAKMMSPLFEKYGKETESGLFEPGMSKWLEDPHGEEMKQVLEVALLQTQKRASLVAGYGTTPHLFDKWYGKLFGQFQSMAFAFGNSFLHAGMQYGAVTGDHMRMAKGMGVLMAAGVVMHSIRSALKGESLEAQMDNPPKLAYDILQRSGVFGYWGSYGDSLVKFLDPATKATIGYSLAGGTGKYANNNPLENLLGPWSNVVGTTGQMLGSIGQGDIQKAAEKGWRLVPYQNYISLIQQLHAAAGN